ncbi:RNA-binding protein 8A [Allomyces javanicus]|nr:RNA-binding protein 8A [Allomyces javanicus]
MSRRNETDRMDVDESSASSSASRSKHRSSGGIRRGRGLDAPSSRYDRDEDMDYETYTQAGAVNTGRVQKSVEGYIICVTNVHEEAAEEDLHDYLSEYGVVRNLHLNLDRRTGFAKGYVLAEYAKFDEALDAVRALDGHDLLGQVVSADFVFAKGPTKGTTRIAPE